MQNAKTVIDVIQKRGEEGKTLERLYRQLFNKEMYMKAYSEIYANKGALTAGSGEDTLDGMSERRIERIIQKVRKETYRWKAVRRVNIPKESGGERPLGIPSGDDKLLQATMKTLIEPFYEPTFSERSHGFRPGRGCHTALQQIAESHRDVSWFIEGDIKGCFDNIDHEILMEIVENKVKDKRFIRLLKHLLKAGYIEDWKWHGTYSGTPQGGIISPLLSNIYMNQFDKWIENELMPLYNRREVTAGRKRNPKYRSYEYKRKVAKDKGDVEAYREYGRLMKEIPSVFEDEGYRKLEYIRYADDFLLSFAGPHWEAEEIKEEIRAYLERELALELSEEKTLITHARTGKARFLGYDIRVMRSNERRKANGQIWFGVPKEVVRDGVRKYSRKGKIHHKPAWTKNSDYDIVSAYQAEYRGLVQYYIMAHNIHLLNKVQWAASTSLLKTLAGKYKSSTTKMSKKYRDEISVAGKAYRVFTARLERKGKEPLTTHFGAVPLKRNPRPSKITDNIQRRNTNKSELLQRMKTDQCEMCGEKGEVEVHHVRKLKDVNKPGKKEKPAWVHRMAAIRRKTLIVCKTCHKSIHAGEYRKEWDKWKRNSGKPGAVKVARPV